MQDFKPHLHDAKMVLFAFYNDFLHEHTYFYLFIQQNKQPFTYQLSFTPVIWSKCKVTKRNYFLKMRWLLNLTPVVRSIRNEINRLKLQKPHNFVRIRLASYDYDNRPTRLER